MEALAFVEVLRNGRLVERVRLAHFPASIGRAYSNPVILDDAQVPLVAARIERDPQGELWLVREHSPAAGVREWIRADRGLSCQLGRTTLRIRTPQHVLSPPPRCGVVDRWIERMADRNGLLLLLSLLALIVIVYGTYQATTGDFMHHGIGPVISGVLALGLWSGLWSLATRTAAHRFRFWAHFLVGSLFTVAAQLLSLVVGYVGFLYGPPQGLDWIIGMLLFVALPVLVMLHMRVAGVHGARALAAGAALSMVAAAALSTIEASGEDAFYTGQLHFNSALLPVPQSMLDTTDVDGFFERAGALKQRLQRIEKEQ